MEKSFENKEKKEISSIDLESFDGLLQWREIYADGTSGSWERTSVGTDDSKGIVRLENELEEKYGEGIVNAK